MICNANEMSSPKVGSPMLDCEYNRITFLERRRVVALTVIETVTKVCNDHEVVTFMLAEECSCACFGGVNACHTISRKSGSCSTGAWVSGRVIASLCVV